MSSPNTEFLLRQILSQPTAPFREGWVAAEIARTLESADIPYFHDGAGNLIAGVQSSGEIAQGFRIALMAHMDHPGFHLEKRARGSKEWHCRWLGGAPYAKMVGARIRLFDPSDRLRTAEGRITKFTEERLPTGQPFSAEFESDVSRFSKDSFGAFAFEGCDIAGDLVQTRAADDLAGCVVALGALLDQKARKKSRPLIAIFTRAEEVGFIGCLHLLKKKILPADLWLVSLEASKALPEAESGRGPVLRIGDSRCLFDAEFSSTLWQVARKLEENTKKTEAPFHFQRRLMSGGMCEGTPLTIFGHQVAAIAVPLLNYHNAGAEGPAPEMISLGDAEGARRLCAFLGEQITRRPSWRNETKKEILRDYSQYETLLKPKIAFDHGADV